MDIFNRAKPIFVVLFLVSISAHGLQIKKNQWVTQFSENFYKYFCKNEAVLKKCYRLTHYQCQEKVNSYIGDCVKQKNVPALLTDSSQSEKWGSLVGQCIGLKFSAEHPLNKKHDECIKI